MYPGHDDGDMNLAPITDIISMNYRSKTIISPESYPTSVARSVLTIESYKFYIGMIKSGGNVYTAIPNFISHYLLIMGRKAG